MFKRVALAFALQSLVGASPSAAPTARLDDATVTGVKDGPLAKFLGIPYATPP